jgi:hypothetical protein
MDYRFFMKSVQIHFANLTIEVRIVGDSMQRQGLEKGGQVNIGSSITAVWGPWRWLGK